tara:strand:+ start:816 stop:2852 length:2037 start_codon:yes stop_codon:yes gene_type:complete
MFGRLSENIMAVDYLNAMGVGAGFDTKAIVSAIVAADKAGEQSKIDRHTKDVDASVSGMAKLKSSLTTLQTAFEKVNDKRDFNVSVLNNSAPEKVYASFDASASVPGTYKISVSQLAQNDVYQSDSVSETLEVDTYSLSGAINASGSASFTHGGVTYTQAFLTDSAKTMGGLVAKINAGSAGSTVTAFATNSTTFTITKDVGSDTQMTKGVIGGTTNGTTSVTGSTADTTAGIGAKTVDQNGTSAATVVIKVGSGAAETVTLAGGSTSLTDLVTGINALTADVSARIVETSNGVYRVILEGPQGSDNVLTITDSVFGLQTTNVLEVDTYTLGAALSSGGSASFTYEGTAYTATSMSGLVAAINAGSAGATVTAEATSGTVFKITKDSASDVQMTKGSISGTSNGSDPLTFSTADTVNGSDGNKLQAALNSNISVNGLSVSSSTNEVDGVVPGLKLDLMATTSTAVVMAVTHDTTVAKSSITALVSAYNAFEVVMEELTSSGSATTDKGALKSDPGVNAIKDKVKSFLTSNSSTPGASVDSMGDIGISLQKNGTFKVDGAALSSALTSHYADITKMFSANTNDQSSFSTSSFGIGGDVVKLISSYLSSSGLVALRDSAYSVKKLSLTEQQATLDKKMTAVELRYTKQFSTMSKIMDEMKSTQDFLESSLSNLPFTAKND